MVREIRIARARERAAHDRDIRLAWWTVRLYAEWRTKKLPALKTLLAPGPQVTRQTPQEAARMLETFSRMYGGPVRPLRPDA